MPKALNFNSYFSSIFSTTLKTHTPSKPIVQIRNGGVWVKRELTVVPGFTPTGVEIAELTYAGAPMTPEWTEYHSSHSSPVIPEK